MAVPQYLVPALLLPTGCSPVVTMETGEVLILGQPLCHCHPAQSSHPRGFAQAVTGQPALSCPMLTVLILVL